MTKNHEQERYDRLFRPDEMLDEVIQRYVEDKITKDDVIFYMYWNEFDMSDVDWDLISAKKKEGKTTYYMILDVYDRCEWVYIYSKIYKSAPKYWHKVYIDACKDFESMGPDDCHKFGVFELIVSDKELKQLKSFIKQKDDIAKDKWFNNLYEEDRMKMVFD